MCCHEGASRTLEMEKDNVIGLERNGRCDGPWVVDSLQFHCVTTCCWLTHYSIYA